MPGNGLFLIAAIAYFPPPVEARYQAAVSTATRAALIQSGLQSDFDIVRAAAERKVPVKLRQAAAYGAIVYKQEFTWRGRVLDGTVNKQGASLLLHWEW